MGKWCLCEMYLCLEKKPNNRLASCWHEAIPTVFKCQNIEEVYITVYRIHKQNNHKHTVQCTDVIKVC